jgi:hypothetical protein
VMDGHGNSHGHGQGDGRSRSKRYWNGIGTELERPWNGTGTVLERSGTVTSRHGHGHATFSAKNERFTVLNPEK